jgi:cell division septal protein FtsQ
MPKLIGRKRKMGWGEITGTTQAKRKVTRALGFSPWSRTRKKRKSCGLLALLLAALATAIVVLITCCLTHMREQRQARMVGTEARTDGRRLRLS